MIVFKNTKGFETRSDKPNENWTENEDVYVVEDGSELAKKIEINYPFFEFVLNENGELIDITPTERPPAPPPKPTEFEELTSYVLDVDYRVIMLEMGLI